MSQNPPSPKDQQAQKDQKAPEAQPESLQMDHSMNNPPHPGIQPPVTPNQPGQRTGGNPESPQLAPDRKQVEHASPDGIHPAERTSGETSKDASKK